MPRLTQILAEREETKKHADEALTTAIRLVSTAPLLGGISKTYEPLTEQGEKLPSEGMRVQVKADKVLEQVRDVFIQLFDITASTEYANSHAHADVVVGGKKLIEKAPATYLLWLEKQLVGLESFIKRLPTLDQADDWERNEVQGLWETKPVETVRTKKLPRNHEKSPATKEHAAQVEVYYEDIGVGKWKTVKFSGAIPPVRQHELLERVRTLQIAVKSAREEANTVQADIQHVGEAFFTYLLS